MNTLTSEHLHPWRLARDVFFKSFFDKILHLTFHLRSTCALRTVKVSWGIAMDAKCIYDLKNEVSGLYLICVKFKEKKQSASIITILQTWYWSMLTLQKTCLNWRIYKSVSMPVFSFNEVWVYLQLLQRVKVFLPILNKIKRFFQHPLAQLGGRGGGGDNYVCPPSS